MKQYRLSAAARADLDEIWFYIAQDNPDAADRFIGALVSQFPKLGSKPDVGRPREELAPHVRSLAFGNHVIFYRAVGNGVEIVRVLHGARDLPPLFE